MLQDNIVSIFPTTPPSNKETLQTLYCLQCIAKTTNVKVAHSTFLYSTCIFK